MFTSSAFAQAANDVSSTTATQPSSLMSMLPLVLIFVVFYFLVIRPQNKRMQEHRTMVTGLQKGDKVVTGGGLIATVKKVSEGDEVVLELAQGVEVTALRSTIMTVRK